MNSGGISNVLGKELRRFNGNFFASPTVLDLSEKQIKILLKAAETDWRNVEPAIFGTMLEQALNIKERQKLGAHYTPRSYVERLVFPTVINPLREDWHNIQSAAELLGNQDKNKEAQRIILEFHRHICSLRILDPACGSGNFLYVTMEHIKRLEAEILYEAHLYGEFHLPLEAEGLTVDPHQFLGLELNPRAAYIAEMVLWIGHWQWHFRTHGRISPPEPILREYRNIECRDAVLEYEEVVPVLDKHGNEVTRWDGETMRVDPVTGREIPDEEARIVEVKYIAPHSASWPDADYIIGNPPFIGGGGDRGKRAVLGGGIFNALVEAYHEVPESSDYVMYWWHKAAEKVRKGEVKQFGFITTNSLKQIFNRRIIEQHFKSTPPLSLCFAIPDHPWADGGGSAAVRIAMSVGQSGKVDGVLKSVTNEERAEGGVRHIELSTKKGPINSDLTIGVDLSKAKPLQSNYGISNRGIVLNGKGFLVTQDQAEHLGFGKNESIVSHIRPYINGRDITAKSRGLLAIDLFGLSESEVKVEFPDLYQWVYERVKPERDQNPRKSRRENWWLFGEPISTFRPAIADLTRYIVTPMTAKHRFFTFLDSICLPDQGLIGFGSDDGYILGVLSSRIHIVWALAAGGRLGVGNDPRYNNSVCFEKFPFPEVSMKKSSEIRIAAEKLDGFRKKRKEMFPELTLTGMYNVLEAVRSGEELTKAERAINEKGLVHTILLQLHEELDKAVADAYRWSADLSDEDILINLVELNKIRAGEEQHGTVRWLRPEYQCPDHRNEVKQAHLNPPAQVPSKAKGKKVKVKRKPWPKLLPEQFQAVRAALSFLGGSGSVEDVAKCYTRAPRARVQEVLDTLAAQGFIRMDERGGYILG